MPCFSRDDGIPADVFGPLAQVDFVYLTAKFFELIGLASDVRVEVPKHLKVEGLHPVGLPVMAWTATATVWALILGAMWQLSERRPPESRLHTKLSVVDEATRAK